MYSRDLLQRCESEREKRERIKLIERFGFFFIEARLFPPCSNCHFRHSFAYLRKVTHLIVVCVTSTLKHIDIIAMPINFDGITVKLERADK